MLVMLSGAQHRAMYGRKNVGGIGGRKRRRKKKASFDISKYLT